MLTITFHFDTVEAAAEFLESQGARAPQQEIEILLPDVQPTLAERTETTDSPPPEPVKKARKPRADAGKPRGPYKKEADEAPATSAAPTTQASAPESSPAPVAADPAPAQKEPTLDDVKAAMSVLSKKVNIDANIKLLAQFGVDRSSLLPKARYAEFIAAALKAAGVS